MKKTMVKLLRRYKMVTGWAKVEGYKGGWFVNVESEDHKLPDVSCN